MARYTRFQYDKRSRSDKRILLTIGVFLIIIVLFYMGFSGLSDGAQQRQRDSLESALNRSIVHYYSVEGHYPETLGELKEDYGLIYDESRFYVDYRLLGSNIYPDVTIIEEVK